MLEFNATFIVAMISFIVFMLMMNSILYKPLARIQKQREDIVLNEYNEAKIADEKAENLREQQRKNLEWSKQLARENFDKKVSEYKRHRDSILERAKTISKKDLAISNAQLNGDKREAKLLLEPKVAELADAIASKVLGFETNIKGSDLMKM